MPIITTDDFKESWSRIHQRGLGYILSKASLKARNRTLSTFNITGVESANWWIIPQVRERWNKLITGDTGRKYEDYVVEKYFKSGSVGSAGSAPALRMLSLGSGSCSHELAFARQNFFSEVSCLDITDRLLNAAEVTAREEGLTNMSFICGDVHSLDLPENSYDMILFHASLHHFKNPANLLENKIRHFLKPGGLLVINEYVGPGRLQWTRLQLKEINRLLKEEIPLPYRRRFRTGVVKRSVSGPGRLRMFISDPSEAVESEAILPALRKSFIPLEETNLGGNILMPLLKDIAHHFVSQKKESTVILNRLFAAEDEFLKKEQSNFVFGVYENSRVI